jgi:hypothetical protein
VNRTREVLNDQYPTIPDLVWLTDAPLTFVIGSRSTWCAGLTGPRAVRKAGIGKRMGQLSGHKQSFAPQDIAIRSASAFRRRRM